MAFFKFSEFMESLEDFVTRRIIEASDLMNSAKLNSLEDFQRFKQHSENVGEAISIEVRLHYPNVTDAELGSAYLTAHSKLKEHVGKGAYDLGMKIFKELDNELE